MMRRSAGGQRFDRVERVHDQVEQDLLNLHRRRLDLRQIVIHLGHDHAFAQYDIGTHQPQRIRDDGVEIERAADDGLILPDQRANSANDFAGALTVGHHVLEQLLQQNRVDVSALEKTTRGRGVVRDRGQRLIQFMRDRGGHFAHQGDPIQMRHLFTLNLQLQIGLFLRADVDRHADEFQEISVLVRQTASAHDDPARLAVRQKEPMLRFEDPCVAHA